MCPSTQKEEKVLESQARRLFSTQEASKYNWNQIIDLETAPHIPLLKAFGKDSADFVPESFWKRNSYFWRSYQYLSGNKCEKVI